MTETLQEEKFEVDVSQDRENENDEKTNEKGSKNRKMYVTIAFLSDPIIIMKGA